MERIDRRCTVLGFGVVMLLASASQAQSPPPGSRDRARTFLVVRIAEALNLPDEKALQVSRILKESGTRRRDLVSRRRDVEGDLRQALDGNAGEAGLLELVAKIKEIDRQIALVPEEGIDEIQKLLTPREQARLALFRPELQKEVRGALRQRLRGAGPPPGRWSNEPE